MNGIDDKLRNSLKEFEDILNLVQDQAIIGGIYALKLHGLKVRDTNDVDIILYQPNEVFVDRLKEEKSTEGSVKDPIEARRRSYQLTRNGLTIDFLIEWDKYEPSHLHPIVINDKVWQVQRIENVIEAKRNYGRQKDLDDIEAIQRDNNINL